MGMKEGGDGSDCETIMISTWLQYHYGIVSL